jgi:hypothetical protein
VGADFRPRRRQRSQFVGMRKWCRTTGLGRKRTGGIDTCNRNNQTFVGFYLGEMNGRPTLILSTIVGPTGSLR